MKIFFSLFSALFVAAGVVSAEPLPVTAGQCSLKVSEPQFESIRTFELQARRTCWIVLCNPHDLGSQYLQLWYSPAPKIEYFTNVQPHKNRAGDIRIDFHFDRNLIVGRAPTPEDKTSVDVHMVLNSLTHSWQSEAIESNRDDLPLHQATTVVPEHDGAIAFSYQMRGNVTLILSCQVPYDKPGNELVGELN